MWKSKMFSYFESCGGWNNGVMGSWTTWLLGFNKQVTWNKRGGAKFEPFLINVVAEITELWVENHQKTICRDVTFIREGRVIKIMLISPCHFHLWTAPSYIKILNSYVTLKNFFRGTYESPRMAASVSWPLLIFR